MFTLKKPMTAELVEAEYKLGRVQIAIERRVKEYCISATEWNLKTERVNKVLGDLLWLRDYLIKRCGEMSSPG